MGHSQNKKAQCTLPRASPPTVWPVSPTHAALVALSPFLPKLLANLGSQESQSHAGSQPSSKPSLEPRAPNPQPRLDRGPGDKKAEAWGHGPAGMSVQGRNAQETTQAAVPLACGAGPPWGVQEDSRWRANKLTKSVARHVSVFTCVLRGQGILGFH